MASAEKAAESRGSVLEALWNQPRLIATEIAAVTFHSVCPINRTGPFTVLASFKAYPDAA